MLYKIREFYLKKIFCNEIIEKIFYYLIPNPYPLYNLFQHVTQLIKNIKNKFSKLNLEITYQSD